MRSKEQHAPSANAGPATWKSPEALREKSCACGSMPRSWHRSSSKASPEVEANRDSSGGLPSICCGTVKSRVCWLQPVSRVAW